MTAVAGAGAGAAAAGAGAVAEGCLGMVPTPFLGLDASAAAGALDGLDDAAGLDAAGALWDGGVEGAAVADPIAMEGLLEDCACDDA